jgi:hypothetical protein
LNYDIMLLKLSIKLERKKTTRATTKNPTPTNAELEACPLLPPLDRRREVHPAELVGWVILAVYVCMLSSAQAALAEGHGPEEPDSEPRRRRSAQALEELLLYP